MTWDGDEDEAFVRFFQQYEGQVRAFVRRRVSNAHDVEDVVSLTMVIAWRRWSAGAVDAPERWLKAIALRVALNEARARRRYAAAVERAVAIGAATQLSRTEASDVDASNAVLRAFAGLREADREVLQLALLDGMTGAELAVALRTSPATARQRLARARARLREAYAHEVEGSAASDPG
jgi:RNA polymerase sigma factor (sigma-70 family)